MHAGVGIEWIILLCKYGTHVSAWFVTQLFFIITCIFISDCLRFCFMHLIEEDLCRTGVEWNSHRIRPSANSNSPPGYPDQLFYMPQLIGRRCARLYLPHWSQRCSYSSAVCWGTQSPLLTWIPRNGTWCDVMNAHHISFPNTISAAVDLYVTLTTILENAMWTVINNW